MKIESMTESEAIGKWDAEIPKKPVEKQTLDHWINKYALAGALPIRKHQLLEAKEIKISEETFKRIIE